MTTGRTLQEVEQGLVSQAKKAEQNIVSRAKNAEEAIVSNVKKAEDAITSNVKKAEERIASVVSEVKDEGGIIGIYNRKLFESPLLTKSIAQMILQSAQEIFAQLFVGEGIDISEILYLAGYGGLIAGPQSYVLGQLAQRVLNGQPPVARIFLGLVCTTPNFSCNFYCFQSMAKRSKIRS